jgi:hypothetical protein
MMYAESVTYMHKELRMSVFHIKVLSVLVQLSIDDSTKRRTREQIAVGRAKT